MSVKPVSVVSIQLNVLGHTTYGQMLRNSLVGINGLNFEAKWVTDRASRFEATVAKVLTTFSWKVGPLRIPTPGFGKARTDLAWGMYGYKRALETLRNGAPDVFHFSTQSSAVLSTHLARHIPITVSLDQTAAQESHGPGVSNGSLIYRPSVYMDRKVFQSASKIFPWSQWAANSVISDYHIPASKVHVVYPGVDLAKMRVSDKSNDFEGGRCKLLFIGNDFERKGGVDIVEVFLNDLSDRCELHLVTNANVTYDHEHIHVHKSVAAFSDRWYALYSAADIFVLPTRYEAFGLVIVEAMASGLPVVSTRINAIPEMVIDGENGFLCEPGNLQELTQSVMRLAINPKLCREMGRKSRQRSEELFDQNKNALAMVEAFREVTNSR